MSTPFRPARLLGPFLVAVALALPVPASTLAVSAAAETCEPVTGPMFDRPASDPTEPLARDTLTIGQLTVPSSDFTRPELGVLQVLADLELCVWTIVADVGGTVTITDLFQNADGIRAQVTLDGDHPGVVDLGVLNGSGDTYLLGELLDSPTEPGIPREEWSARYEVAWLTGQDATEGWYGVGIDGAPGSAVATAWVTAFTRILIEQRSAGSIAFEHVPTGSHVTLGLPPGSHVGERLVEGAAGCARISVLEDGRLWLDSLNGSAAVCGDGFPAVDADPDPPANDPSARLTMPPTNVSDAPVPATRSEGLGTILGGLAALIAASLFWTRNRMHRPGR